MYNENQVINRNTKLQVTILTLCVMQLFLLININNSLVYQSTEKMIIIILIINTLNSIFQSVLLKT